MDNHATPLLCIYGKWIDPTLAQDDIDVAIFKDQTG